MPVVVVVLLLYPLGLIPKALEEGEEDPFQGMTPEVRARCLDPFYTTKGDHGSGLGLSSVQGAMADHGGVLHIETTPGAGCRVHMFVPVAAP